MLFLSLYTHGDGRNAMHWAARNGRTEICEWLWGSHGVDVNRPTKDGTTPFHWAVWQGHLDTCRWLVDVARADWSTLNSYGCNAGQWAAQTGDVEVCQYLLELGLDLRLLNNNGTGRVHVNVQPVADDAVLVRHRPQLAQLPTRLLPHLVDTPQQRGRGR